MKPIDGPRALPAAYPHPHASDEARRVAEAGMILRAQVGSGLHGTSISGQDDRDEMGICLEPARFVTGVSGVPRGPNSEGEHPFAQYRRHTVWDQPGGLADRSGAGLKRVNAGLRRRRTLGARNNDACRIEPSG